MRTPERKSLKIELPLKQNLESFIGTMIAGFPDLHPIAEQHAREVSDYLGKSNVPMGVVALVGSFLLLAAIRTIEETELPLVQ